MQTQPQMPTCTYTHGQTHVLAHAHAHAHVAMQPMTSIRATCIFHVWDMTHSRVWHDSFTPTTWLLDMRDVTRQLSSVTSALSFSSSPTHCNTLQHTATHCNTLQHTATRCNTLHHSAAHRAHCQCQQGCNDSLFWSKIVSFALIPSPFIYSRHFWSILVSFYIRACW